MNWSSDKELQKVKNRYRYSQVSEYLKNGDVGSRISKYECYFGWDFFDQFQAKVKAVTKEDVQKVMQKYFNPDQVTVAYQYPKDGGVSRKTNETEESIKDDQVNILSSGI